MAAISMGRDLLQKKEERASLTKPTLESDPSADRRLNDACVRLLDLRQDEDGHWVAVLSCGHTQHLRHLPPWQNRAWVLDPQQRSQQLGQPFSCGWCNAEAVLPPSETDKER